MLIKLIGDPRRLVEVRTFLEARPDCIVRQLGDDELEVFLLGSFRESLWPFGDSTLKRSRLRDEWFDPRDDPGFVEIAAIKQRLAAQEGE